MGSEETGTNLESARRVTSGVASYASKAAIMSTRPMHKSTTKEDQSKKSPDQMHHTSSQGRANPGTATTQNHSQADKPDFDVVAPTTPESTTTGRRNEEIKPDGDPHNSIRPQLLQIGGRQIRNIDTQHYLRNAPQQMEPSDEVRSETRHSRNGGPHTAHGWRDKKAMR